MPLIGTESGSGTAPIEKANYSALPPVGTAPGQTYIVLASQGTAWLPGSLGGTYYPEGYYYDNGVTYTYSKYPYNASQSTVNTGTNNNEFVTSLTLTNSTQWATKENTIVAGTTAQYWRGDKTFQTLDTSIVPENTNLYFTNARAIASTLTAYVSGAGVVAATDTILQAIQKLNGNTVANTYAFSTGLTNTTGTITNNLSTGIAGGQTINGGTAASEILTLSSTSNATKGRIQIGATDLVNIGNAATLNQRLVRIGQGTSVFDLGNLTTSASTPAIYFNQGTPSGINYAISGLSNLTTLNSTLTVDIRVNDVIKAEFETGRIAFTTSNTTGAGSVYAFNTSTKTIVLAGTENKAYNFDMGTSTKVLQHNGNALVPNQRDFFVTNRHHAFSTAGGIETVAATMFIEGASVASSNCTIIDNSALLVGSANVITSTGVVNNSYGATINAQIGGAFNYAARFLGGNVGFGTSTPTGLIHALGIDAATLANQILEPITNVTEVTTGNTVNTTNATNTTLETIAVPTNTILMIESKVTCRKTGGAGVGITGEGNGYIIIVKAQNIAGVVTIGVVQTSFTSESIAFFDTTFVVSGTNIILQVIGAVNDNVTWNSITKKYKVS